MLRSFVALLVAPAMLVGCCRTAHAGAPDSVRSHPPMRAVPAPSERPMGKAPARFVEPARGDDRHDGSNEKPWKTIAHALQHLKPGETLCLRGGTYYESVTVNLSGTAEKPITLRGYPGELAIIDGGLREFYEDPAGSWEPVPDGAPGEFRSTKSYKAGGGAGNFGDSMVPFQRYLTFNDLRSTNELWHSGLSNRVDDPQGIYAGPGVRRDPRTGRVHIRLAHTRLAGLGKSHYRGETDPRKLPLVIAGHGYALLIVDAAHVRVQDLVVRGAQRSAVRITDSQDIELDGVTLYGSGSALRTSRTSDVRLINSALRGHAAPWHSRSHHKDRSGSGYLVVAQGKDFEFAHCEFTGHHDGVLLKDADGVKFHHNLVDNFNDDGIEPGPKRQRGRMLIYQNVISRCLNPFTLHGKKANPVESEPGSGTYIYRNVVDLRRGTYKHPPREPDPSGAFLEHPTTMVAHDHGGPTWPVYYVYHNTFVLSGNAWRGYYGLGWGSHMRGTTRRVFNNIFVQVEGVPGLNFSAVAPDDDFEADGNLHWGLKDGPKHDGDFFGKWRSSKAFLASKKQHPPGWAAHDLFADPKFVRLDAEGSGSIDVRCRLGSPVIDSGVKVPAEWPDPLRDADEDGPDIGALPIGSAPLKVGCCRPDQG